MRDCNLWSSSKQTDEAMLKKLMNQVRLFGAAFTLEYVMAEGELLQHDRSCCSLSLIMPFIHKRTTGLTRSMNMPL